MKRVKVNPIEICKDLWPLIFKYMPPQKLLQFRGVSKQWKEIINEKLKPLWSKHLCKLPIVQTFPGGLLINEMSYPDSYAFLTLSSRTGYKDPSFNGIITEFVQRKMVGHLFLLMYSALIYVHEVPIENWKYPAFEFIQGYEFDYVFVLKNSHIHRITTDTILRCNLRKRDGEHWVFIFPYCDHVRIGEGNFVPIFAILRQLLMLKRPNLQHFNIRQFYDMEKERFLVAEWDNVISSFYST